MRLNPSWVMGQILRLGPHGLVPLNALMKEVYKFHVFLLNVF